MNAVDDVIMVVQGGVQVLVMQPGIFPDFLQGVVLHQAAILKDSHQQILRTERTH